jgi:hypothetical protein
MTSKKLTPTKFERRFDANFQYAIIPENISLELGLGRPE